MDKDWRTILRFAALGFGAAAAAAATQFVPVSWPENYSLGAIAIVICPASLLLAPVFVSFFEAAETGTAGFYVLWMLVGLVNAALYAIAAAAYIGLRKKPERPATG